MKKAIFLIGILLFFGGCWDRQRNDVTAPEIPHYQMTGEVYDIDSRQILSNVEVKVVARGVLFETEITTASDTTDSLGNFKFPYLVPGRYDIYGIRDSHPVGLQQIVIFDSDRNIKLPLPKPIDALRIVDLSKKEPGEFLGFCWKFSGTFAGVGFWNAGKFSENRVFEGNFLYGFEVLGKKNITPENPDFYGLTYLDRYWTCDSVNLLSVSSITGKFESSIRVPFRLIDLTNDGQNIWATMEGNRLLKFDQYLMQVINLPTIVLEGIAWDGENIWISDSQFQLIFKLDENANILQTFSPFFVDEYFNPRRIETYRYMAFDPNGHLWIGNGSLLYEFALDQSKYLE